MATAHAKARLSKNVEDEDARAAIELVQFAYFKRVLEKERKKRRRHDRDASENADEIDESRQTKRSRKTKDSGDSVDPYEFDNDETYEKTESRRITRTQSQRISTRTSPSRWRCGGTGPGTTAWSATRSGDSP